VIKKFLQKIFKTISYKLFLYVHGKVEGIIDSESDKRVNIETINLEEDLKYNIYKINDARLYTDRIHDAAVLLDNKVVEGPSLQLRYKPGADYRLYNSKAKESIVFEKGTPRIIRKINGSVFSLLTGGAGNDNYWHWIYDVLPRIGLYKKKFDLNKIDYFLLPGLLRKFQNETLDILNIPKKKRLSSKKYRHVQTQELFVTDHPIGVSGNFTKDIQNIPSWIINWLKNNFINKKEIDKNLNNKIYIERESLLSKNNTIRSISNEDEVKLYLIKMGFTIVKFGEISFREQANIFYNAECIIGLHGAAFANLAFCKPQTKVVELKSLTAGPVIENLAKKINLDYNSVTSEAEHTIKYDFPTQQGHIKVPISSLKKILENN
jgi:capsular polysaccharide biosynthesis protein